ncbi:MAG: CHAT domain-containing protein, partial [Candidatus Eremiobacteraeota bacterium]|nr:CHAT domain-containing protein [Candidatus Eremiobacteraeota bacterium]
FELAGASSVIASRWKVEDEVTGAFFELFYGALLRGESRGEALRSAQLGVAKTHPHPYYWAAFSLLGDAR